MILAIRVVGGPPVDPRPFRLELLAMDLSGVAIPGDVCVRESPVLASLGQGQADDGLPGAT